MNKNDINLANWKEAGKAIVKANPTLLYQRLKYLYGTEVPNYTTGYERNGSSIATMQQIVERKAVASGDPVAYLTTVL